MYWIDKEHNHIATCDFYGNNYIITTQSVFDEPFSLTNFDKNLYYLYDNKIKIKTLSYDTSGALTSIVSNTLLTNLAEYLSNYRMLNDYISVETAQVIDLAVEVSIVLDASQNQGAVIGSVINKITDYFNPAIRQLGQNVNVSEINKIIQSENGVLSLTDLKVFNQVGGQYSSSETSQSYSDSATKQIGLIDNTILANGQ